MSAYYVADDAENEPTIWHAHLYSDDTALIRRCDLPAKDRDSLWRALIRGYGCEVRNG